MDKQICKNCKEEKDFVFFNKNNTYKLGITRNCKVCIGEKNKPSRDMYKQKNKVEISIKNKIYSIKNFDRYKQWREDNKVSIKEKQKLYRENNKEKKRVDDKNYRIKNKDHIAKKQKEYANNNRQKTRDRMRERFKNDPIYSLSTKLRNRLRFFLRRERYLKDKSSVEVFGLDYESIKKYIERKFTKEMTWDKFLNGEVHIDHIIPVSSAKTLDEVYKLNHYTNLQPLLAKDNLAKGCKMPMIQTVMTI